MYPVKLLFDQTINHVNTKKYHPDSCSSTSESGLVTPCHVTRDRKGSDGEKLRKVSRFHTYLSVFLCCIIIIQWLILRVKLLIGRLSMYIEERMENRCLCEDIAYDVVANLLIAS